MSWISAKKKPKSLHPVLFIMTDRHGTYQLTGWWDKLNKEWVSYSAVFLTPCHFGHYDDDLRFKAEYVTHWMELPELPSYSCK